MASSEPPSSPVHNVAPENRFKAPQISVAINPVALVTSECITVTSAMRKNARWAQSSVSAILGGGGTGYGSSGFETPVPGSPSPMLARRGDFEGQVGMTGRWGLRGKKGRSIQDNPLMAAFAKLRGDLQECSDISKFDTPSLLHPFLQVIRSSSTSGPITSLALVAIAKFFSYNLITRDSPRLPLAMQLLSSAVTHCRFEASDSAQDEVVLLRILKLMEMMISGPGGEVLGDESVCEMMETGLSMCCQMRLSEMLRRSAEMGMVTMCQVIFQRLKTLELEADESGGDLDEDLKNEMDSVKMEPAGSGANAATAATAAATAERSSASLDETHPDRPTIAPSPHDLTGGITEPRPYSLPSIRELLRVLVELLDPHDLTNTDTKRIMAMRIIDVAFEVAGPSIAKHPSLADLARDSLCKYLFQLVRSDTMGILQESLRVTTTLLATTRGVLKLQQELFISYLVACLHPQIEIPREPGVDPLLYKGVPQAPKLVKPAPSQQTNGRSTPVPVKERQKLGLEGGIRRPDAREAMVECIGALSRIPSFMVELYINYDCNVDRADLCEDVIGLLSRNAFPDSATWSTTNVPPLCLDALLGYVNFVAERLRDNPVYEGFPRPEELQQQRAKKQVVIDCIAKFNEDPKKGIVALAQEGIIKNVEDAESIAKFLQGTSRVNKKILGEFLSKKQNEEILKAFMNTFDFGGKRADEALREILETFRLPGESQLIERIVTKFSERYCEAKENLKDVADEDSAFVLTYAIIMLNTDQHNPNMKNANRMKYEDFARNLRGVNGGKDFDPAYLQNIYDTIKNNEIILPDEHDNKHAFDYTWRELLHKTESAGEMLLCNTNIYDAQMFATTWKPIVATLSYVFISATDDAVFSRVITGFDQCARIAAAYNITEALDDIVHRLSIISKLSSDEPPNTSLNTEIQVNGNSVMVSEMAVKFGRDFKAQLATVVMFRVVTGNEAVLNAGWDKIVRTWLNLFVNKLIPPFFSPSKSGLDLPPIPLQPPSVVIDRNQTAKEVGLFSTLSSYLSSYANDEPPEPSDEELDCTLTTVDCVNACFLGDVFANIMELSSDSLQALIESLLRQVPDWDTEETEVVVTKPNSYPASPMAGVSPIRKSAPTYDPALVYILEFTTCLVLRDEDTTAAYGKPLATILTSVIRNATRIHPLVISRTIYYLFSLLESSHEHSFLNPPIVLHSVTALENTTLEKSAHSIIKGLDKCVKGSSSSLRNSIINSPDFWVLLRALLTDQEIVEDVFSVLSFIADDAPHNVTSDNYLAVVSLLNDFASEASIGSNYEQKAEKDRFLHASQGGLKRSASSASRKSRVSTEEKASEQAANGPQPPKNPAASTVARGVKAVSTIQHLTSRVPSLITSSHLEPQEAWATYWLPIFQSLSSQCTNPCREVRSQALAFLRQCLLSPTLTIDKEEHNEWTAIFGDVLFPLITRLLKPEVFQCDPRGMAITRVETAKLLLTVFAHYLVVLTEWDGMLGLWCKILDVMDRLMNSGQGHHLEEAVSESLKNILLVMTAGGYLIRPEEGPCQDKQELWEQTWRRLERFLPDMKAELFPPLPASPIKEDVPPVPPPAPTEPENNGEKGTVEVTVGEVEANGDTEEIKVQDIQHPQRVDDEID